MHRTKEILNRINITIEEKTGIGNIVTATDKRLEEYLKSNLNIKNEIKIYQKIKFYNTKINKKNTI